MASSSRRRVKRVTDPLDDRVKAQLLGASYFSSGSEHSTSNVVTGDDSPCLSELVHSFLELEDYTDHAAEQTGDGADCMDTSLDIDTASLQILVKLTALNDADSYRNLLAHHVSKAIEMFSIFKSDKSILRRQVMTYLRESAGYNAAICKTKWSTSSSSTGSITGGNHEFIDVMQSVSLSSASTWQQNRYFIDLDFASEFEIAMPTTEYSRLLRYCPRVFVGKKEELIKMVRAMSDSAERSLKSKGLSLPPWRKNRYMQNKWFGSYRRTTNQTTANSDSVIAATVHPVNVVQCRLVGFDDAVNGRLVVRTR